MVKTELGMKSGTLVELCQRPDRARAQNSDTLTLRIAACTLFGRGSQSPAHDPLSSCLAICGAFRPDAFLITSQTDPSFIPALLFAREPTQGPLTVE